MAAAEVSDGDGAMVEADGSAAAEELVAVVAEPPHAVRLSSAAAATPATVKVVRLKDCISILLGCADHCLRRTVSVPVRWPYSDCGHRPLVGVSMGIRPMGGGGWVNRENFFGRARFRFGPGGGTGA
jgi:hypothetical protein